MRDMIPRGERSIRNIPVPPSHHRAPSPRPAPEDIPPESYDPPERPRLRRRRRMGRKFWFIAGAIVVVCTVGALLLSTVFAGATVTLYARTEPVTPPATLDARLNAPVGTLAYQQMTVRRSATTTVAASGSAPVSRQASGIITVYNTYGTEAQKLIANTRFQAPDSKIYRIRESVTVPGGTKNTDGSLKPGTISVTVYADSPGAEYNRADSTRFTIPGFKGDPRFDKFYAQSQGSISGGFVGNEPAVPPTELAKAQAALKLELDSATRAAAQSELPEGFISLPGTLSISYGDIMRTPQGSSASLSQSAAATLAIVREQDLAAAVARGSLGANYEGEAVAFKDKGQLAIRLSTSTTAGSDGVLRLNLSGSPTLVWQFDPEAVKQALLGKSRDALQEVIGNFSPAIVQADATIRPFWQGSFPSDGNKIKVITAQEPVD